MTDITVPALGESVTEATVATWLKKPGDPVAKDDVLVELETDKVSLEVNAPEDGVMSEIVAEEGATVEIGALLARMDGGASASNGNGATQSSGSPSQTTPAQGATSESASLGDAAASGGEIIDVAVPQMGESVTEGTISSWLKKEGEAVAKDDALAEIETDKVSVEVPAPADGVVAKILIAEGETVEVGKVIAQVSAGAGAAVAPQAAAPAPQSAPAPAPAPAAASAQAGAKAMPAARRVMAENGMDQSQVQGTGKDGRITKADALAALENRAAPAPAPTQARAPAPVREPSTLTQTGPREERVRMTRLRSTIARRLKEAQNTAAMLTTFNDVDMTNVMAARKKYKDLFEKKHGIKLGFMSFFTKAVIQALKDVPAVNAEIDGDELIYKNYYDVGIAVGTDKGLVVPVVRDADALSLGGIEMAIADLGRRARDGKLAIDDMQGATFTITNGGIYGSLLSTPILNAPQSGILGMHRIEERPVVVNGEVKARPMMYLALTYDHRIVDGKEAVTFLVRVKECIEDPDRLLLDL